MKTALALTVLLASINHAAAWGFVAHRIITDNCVVAMPPAMAPFYKAAAQALSDASIEPDSILKDREGEREKRRHYIDLDELSLPPFGDLPIDEQKARARYGDEKIDAAGTLPWRIVDVLGQLRDAFQRKDWGKVVSRSGWLSHYVADACQPLHTTKNHDGQNTCNIGVHMAFETDMIDIRKSLYKSETALPASFVAEVIGEPGRFIFAEIIGSYGLAGDILRADTEAVSAVKKQRKDYYEEMERQVGPLARRQMTRAAAITANLWYTAWVEAGRPNLPPSPPPRTAPPPPKAGRP